MLGYAWRIVGDHMDKLLELAAKVSNGWTLAAFGICAIVFLFYRRRGKVPKGVLVAIIAICILALFPIYVHSHAVYRVRVIVLGSDGLPIEDARVVSSLGGEAKKIAGGWEFDIPTSAIARGGHLTVYAQVPNAFLTGKTDLALGDDLDTSVTIQLTKNNSATVRGILVSTSGQPLAKGQVGVIGFEPEAVETGRNGGFALEAHASEGQQVELFARKVGFIPAQQWVQAGDDPITLVLKRKP